MTGRRTDHRTAAKALQVQCPRCGALSGMRCSVMSRGQLQHVRLHVERLTVARQLIRKAYAV